MRITLALLLTALVLTSPESVVATNSSSIATCDHLRRVLGPALVTSAGAPYDQVTSNSWNSFNGDLHPTCIVLPTNSNHAQTAMKSIFRHGSRYSVQSGGHALAKGWSSLEDGVLISFIGMKDISYNSATNIITLAPGISWGEAVRALEPRGIAPMGGRVSNVGTGLLLVGGLSFHSPQYGYSADLLKSVEVVLVDGKLVTATATNQYKDLFRALKGGANRFGIVTKYEVEAIPSGRKTDLNYFGGTVVWDISTGTQVMDAIARYHTRVHDPRASILLYVANVWIGGVFNSFVTANLFYHGASLPESIFGELLAIPTLSTTFAPLSHYDIEHYLVDPDISKGQMSGASAFAADKRQYRDAFNTFMNFTTTFKDSFESTILAFTPVTSSHIKASRQRGGNIMNPPRPYTLVEFAMAFPVGVPEIPADVEAGRQLWFKQNPPVRGLPLYIGESDLRQNVYETYTEYEFTKTVYRKYDPTRFIVRQMQGPIGL